MTCEIDMLDRNLVTPVAPALPTLLLTIAVVAASLAVSRYLDATEQIDIHQYYD